MAVREREPAGHTPDERYRGVRRVTLVGALVNVALAAVKILVGIVGQSQALFADGLHSLSDLASDGIVLWAAKQGAQEPDEDHPYGHARFETAASVALAVLLIGVAIGIVVDAARRLMAPELLLHPGFLALGVAVLSVLSKEVLYQYTHRAADVFRSNLLRANAWHHRSDAISSVIVLAGIGGTMAGFPVLDSVGAILVALMIGKIGLDLGWRGIKELVDTGLEAEQVEEFRRAILDVDGVDTLHMLRTRRMGHTVLVDVHILVAPHMSVSEGHQIAEVVRRTMIERFDEVGDVMVHIDPEDDQDMERAPDLPDRATVLAALRERWRDIPRAGGAGIGDVTLHYLGGRVVADVCVPFGDMQTVAEARELARALARAGESLDWLAEIRVYFH